MSFKLPEPIISTLLDKLGSDDDFRIMFSNDPRKALAHLGFGPAADASKLQGIWDCWKVSCLASKESIIAARSILLEQFRADWFPQSPFMLDSTAKPATGRAEKARLAA